MKKMLSVTLDAPNANTDYVLLSNCVLSRPVAQKAADKALAQETDYLLSHHILPVSATMLGVCMTVISIISVLSHTTGMLRNGTGLADDLLAMDSLIFLFSTVCSYLSIRSAQGRAIRLERLADLIFMFGLLIMVVVTFVLVYLIA